MGSGKRTWSGAADRCTDQLRAARRLIFVIPRQVAFVGFDDATTVDHVVNDLIERGSVERAQGQLQLTRLVRGLHGCDPIATRADPIGQPDPKEGPS